MGYANLGVLQLADTSPLPIVIYNFPNVVAGLDVNSDMLHQLAKHANIKAVKLTCGGIAKVARVSASYSPAAFTTLAGQSDWLSAALSLGGTGVITGVANAFPKACMRVYDLHRAGKTGEASKAQLELARMEWGFGLAGVNGTKWAVAQVLGYPEGSWHCRRPYPRFEDGEKRGVVMGLIGPFAEVEKGIDGKRGA
jgi:4-hydroxy-2-oxoglutarate aldolase